MGPTSCLFPVVFSNNNNKLINNHNNNHNKFTLTVNSIPTCAVPWTRHVSSSGAQKRVHTMDACRALTESRVHTIYRVSCSRSCTPLFPVPSCIGPRVTFQDFFLKKKFRRGFYLFIYLFGGGGAVLPSLINVTI